jgi:hypothetical protein
MPASARVERYGYQPSAEVLQWYHAAIEGRPDANPDIQAVYEGEADSDRAIWKLRVCGAVQRVVYDPQCRLIVTFLPLLDRAGKPRKPHKSRFSNGWGFSAPKANRRNRRDVKHEEEHD